MRQVLKGLRYNLKSRWIGYVCFINEVLFPMGKAKKAQFAWVIQHAVSLLNGSPSIFFLLFPSAATVTTTGPASFRASCKRNDECTISVLLDILSILDRASWVIASFTGLQIVKSACERKS